MYNVRKKDGTLEPYNEQKIIDACNKAARRAMYELSDKGKEYIYMIGKWDEYLKYLENEIKEI